MSDQKQHSQHPRRPSTITDKSDMTAASTSSDQQHSASVTPKRTPQKLGPRKPTPSPAQAQAQSHLGPRAQKVTSHGGAESDQASVSDKPTAKEPPVQGKSDPQSNTGTPRRRRRSRGRIRSQTPSQAPSLPPSVTPATTETQPTTRSPSSGSIVSSSATSVPPSSAGGRRNRNQNRNRNQQTSNRSRASSSASTVHPQTKPRLNHPGLIPDSPTHEQQQEKTSEWVDADDAELDGDEPADFTEQLDPLEEEEPEETGAKRSMTLVLETSSTASGNENAPGGRRNRNKAKGKANGKGKNKSDGVRLDEAEGEPSIKDSTIIEDQDVEDNEVVEAEAETETGQSSTFRTSRRRRGGGAPRRMMPKTTSSDKSAATKGKGKGKDVSKDERGEPRPLKLRLELDLDLELELKARIKGDVTLAVL